MYPDGLFGDVMTILVDYGNAHHHIATVVIEDGQVLTRIAADVRVFIQRDDGTIYNLTEVDNPPGAIVDAEPQEQHQ